MRACTKYVLVTVSSNVSASFSSSTTRGSTGCTDSLLIDKGRGLNMLAQDLMDGEDARAAVLPGARPLTHLRHAAGALVPGLGDVARRHHAAMADDHVLRLACPRLRCHRVVGNPRSTCDDAGSGQRDVTTLPRV